MPKGVEHTWLAYRRNKNLAVSIPLMPKGVEHDSGDAGTITSRPLIVDTRAISR